MLPQTPPKIPGYAVALAYRPACAVTGDYHDFFPFRDGHIAAFIGDASGHGPAACVLGATARAVFRTYPGLHAAPGDTLTTVNRLLSGVLPSDLFMTGVYLALESDGRGTWASAGHMPPLRISPAGGVTPPDLTPVGLPLGINADEVYSTIHWQLAPGERLLLFTDGLWEVRNRHGQALGRHRLYEESVRRAGLPLASLVCALVARAVAHRGGNEFEDDFTVLAFERLAS
jgi:serine phosphatase RsbU (regulator of sigma subunit)